jgi:hypothetical protein
VKPWPETTNAGQCEATRIRGGWTRQRCKLQGTWYLAGRLYCDKHATILSGQSWEERMAAFQTKETQK